MGKNLFEKTNHCSYIHHSPALPKIFNSSVETFKLQPPTPKQYNSSDNHEGSYYKHTHSSP